MSVIEASSAGVRDMADGSLRITVEFEPRHAKEAYALFGTRGTPLAIAALKTGFAAVPEPEKTKIGPLAYWAVMRCKEEEFFRFMETAYKHFLGDVTPYEFKTHEDFCRHAILVMCNCEYSRSEIDRDDEKARLFHENVRGPYAKYLAARGLA